MMRPWRALPVLCIANFLVLLDTTIVNTAVPDLMGDLGVGIEAILWVLNGYLLALASLLMVFGRLGDVLGPRTLFVAGLGLFTVTSVLCGLSESAAQLIAARVAQGVGAAMLTPQALVLISAIFPAHRRGAAFGIFTAVAGIASVSGPVLGGLLVTEFGWRSVFYLNLPIGVAGIVLALRTLPDPRPSRQPRPLVPLDLYRDRNYRIATAITFIMSFALSGFLLVYVIETQTMLGMSPLMSGVSGLPWTLTLSALAPLAGRLADRVGGRILVILGLAVNAAGVLGIAALSTTSASAATFVVPLMVIGIGQGLAIAPTTTEAMRGIGSERAGAASGVLNTARYVGVAVGAAVIGAILESRLGHGMSGAVRPTLAVVAAVSLLGSALALLMVRRPALQPVA